MGGLCPFRLEVRDRHHTTTYQCELPDGHRKELGHRSMLLTEGLERASVVELYDDADHVDSLIRRRDTLDVIVVWK